MMREIIIVTPVTEPHNLAALFKSLLHPFNFTIHWFVVFDCTQVRQYHTWQQTFSFHQEDNINVHCILSDRYQSLFGFKNINVSFDVLENHVLRTDPCKADCWVYQLNGNTELHPTFLAYLNDHQYELSDKELIFFNDLLPERMQITLSNMGSFCFRLRLLNGLRYACEGYNLIDEVRFINTLNRRTKAVHHSQESIPFKEISA
jgi:hypothetical protein